MLFVVQVAYDVMAEVNHKIVVLGNSGELSSLLTWTTSSSSRLIMTRRFYLQSMWTTSLSTRLLVTRWYYICSSRRLRRHHQDPAWLNNVTRCPRTLLRRPHAPSWQTILYVDHVDDDLIAEVNRDQTISCVIHVNDEVIMEVDHEQMMLFVGQVGYDVIVEVNHVQTMF